MGVGHPTPAGLYAKGNTSEGLCDMLGNVWEWCEDWYGPYGAQPQRDPCGPKSGNGRVVRGGSWNGITRFVRASDRDWIVPSVRDNFIGFRCVGEFR